MIFFLWSQIDETDSQCADQLFFPLCLSDTRDAVRFKPATGVVIFWEQDSHTGNLEISSGRERKTVRNRKVRKWVIIAGTAEKSGGVRNSAFYILSFTEGIDNLPLIWLKSLI